MNLSIKSVPESLAEALRARAERNHRSLQGELMAIIEQAVNEPARPSAWSAPAVNPQATDIEPRGPRIVGYDRRGFPIVKVGWKTPDELIADITARGQAPVLNQPLGRDIIREDRDSR
jgi:plasmid stability protein